MLRHVARLIAPPTCVGCSREGEPLCATCAVALMLAPPEVCFCCGHASRGNLTCAGCRPITALAGVAVAAEYGGVVRDLIHRLKYRRQREAAKALAGGLAPLLPAANFDAVTAVPVATSRLRQRGYNQSELIARYLARDLALPYRRLLRRLRNTQQVGKSRAERLAQVENVFVAGAPVRAQRILVVDDVLTTGATLNACAIALRMAGAAEVWGAAAARD